jgi:hydrogenase maturation protein HypF
MTAARPIHDAERRRLRVRVRGTVQGVGFRPFAFGVAQRLALGGFVRNDCEGVLLEVEGARVGEFVYALRNEQPPLARIDSIEVDAIAARGQSAFEIRDSVDGATQTRIPADAATCDACLDDLFDPASRFHLYPFVNCTHCGPRFTLTRHLPYDRAQTSMATFRMCAECARDYRDPANRRFHAEPIACPRCGPRLSHDVSDIVTAVRAGKIVAVKGVGGYHLMCDARNADAIGALRVRKSRDAKPFAVMVANVASIRLFARATSMEVELASSPAHPIVLVERRDTLPDAIAPRLSRIGLLLPYAPLHHLIFHAAAPELTREAPSDFAIVATSANHGGEPLIVDDAEAQRKLASIADLIVSHDRRIIVRADDSVVASIDSAPAFLRRARGYVPDPIELAEDGPCVLACGGHLKATVTVTRGREAFVSQHAGDLSDAATFGFYRETIAHLLGLLDVAPEAVACDLHPDYLSTRYAEETGLPLIRVQHHVAHIAAVVTERRLEGAVLGAALDGHGLGADGAAWGGELLQVAGARWSRRGHLAPLALPGGDRAAREPWRMGLAALAATGRFDAAARFIDTPQAGALARALKQGRAFPQTTSLGRLFDAAAAILGFGGAQAYEGQAAMEMEARVVTPRALDDGFALRDGVLDFRPLLSFLIDEAPSPREGAELFHGTLAQGLAAWIAADAAAPPGALVALGGGCMMNRVLAEDLSRILRAAALEPIFPRAVPANDGGLSLGQAAFARAHLSQT